MRLPRITIGRLLLLATFLLAAVIACFQPHCANTWSRLAAAQALVERGTLSIDHEPSTPGNVDKVFVRGTFYSDKPPTLSLLAAAVYYPVYHLGFRLNGRRNIAYWVITVLLIAGSTLLGLAAFYAALGLVGLTETARLLMTAGLAFATLLLSWSVTLNNHSFAGAWVFISFYFLLKAKLEVRHGVSGALAAARAKVGPRLLLAGVAVGLAGAADSASVLFAAGFGCYVLYSTELRLSALWYAVSAFLVMLPGIWISHSITGDFRPIAVHSEYFVYPGSYWVGGPESISGVQRNAPGFALRYAANCLFGPRGFLLLNPLLLIAIYEAIRTVAGRRKLWLEALLVLALCAAFCGYFFLYSSNYSGSSYSIRWFVTLIPILWFFAFPFFENWSAARNRVYLALCTVSIAFALIGAINPWTDYRRSGNSPAFVVNWRETVVPTVRHFFPAI